MLEDLLEQEAAAARLSQLPQTKHDYFETHLRNALGVYLPMLKQFCSESGWEMRDNGLVVASNKSLFSRAHSNLCLYLFLEGPEKPFRSQDYAGIINAGINIYLWFDRVGVIKRQSRLFCATFNTKLNPYDNDHYCSWPGNDQKRLEKSLRGAFRLYGSRPSVYNQIHY